ncbi:hypothetical protein NDU88_006928 [Pleurodeles waltl]|uniref:Uncharacterized protein n=1 Tax=Pleurodeles waltl TaxID=8319 RepID=A0AAV7QJB5_PLEWA|nr:hypothetical protein NDU88_006928 [Pleurodeles waltl]
MAMARWLKRKKLEGRFGQRTRKTNRQKMERRRCVEEDRGTKMKPRRLEETENRKKTESKRIQLIEEGEDAQKPATS